MPDPAVYPQYPGGFNTYKGAIYFGLGGSLTPSGTSSGGYGSVFHMSHALTNTYSYSVNFPSVAPSSYTQSPYMWNLTIAVPYSPANENGAGEVPGNNAVWAIINKFTWAPGCNICPPGLFMIFNRLNEGIYPATCVATCRAGQYGRVLTSPTLLIEGVSALDGMIYYSNPTQGGVCADCGATCATCSDQFTCLTCKPGLKLFGGNCSSSCPTGYFYHATRKACTACNPLCTACNNTADQCQSCAAGAFLLSPSTSGGISSCTTKCPSFPPSCVVLSVGQSLGCATPTADCIVGPQTCMGTFGNHTSRVCAPCPYQCANCSDTGSSCFNCVPGYPFYLGNCMPSPQSCPHGLVSFNNRCVQSCPVKFFNASGLCTPCGSNCDQCVSSSVCTTCTRPWLNLPIGSCVASCPVNMYTNASMNCVLCERVARNCTTCINANTCTSCAIPLRLYRVNMTCGSECPLGLWSSPVRICENCPETCRSCTNMSNCQTCKPNNYLNETSCGASCPSGDYKVGQLRSTTGKFSNASNWNCDMCHANCTSCDGNRTACYSCKKGRALHRHSCLGYNACPGTTTPIESFTGSVCMQCGFNCATCSDIKNCLTCNPTYVVNNGYCCRPGYFAVQDVTDEGQCATCISNCAVCKDGTSCTQCAVVNNTMYSYVEGACVPPKPGTDASQVAVQVTLKIITTLEAAMLPAWQSAFAQVVAFALNISSSRVAVTKVEAASVLVTTQISPDPVDPLTAITPSIAGTLHT
jgi:proprotein convertase subtilisin/kexin type 5